MIHGHANKQALIRPGRGCEREAPQEGPGSGSGTDSEAAALSQGAVWQDHGLVLSATPRRCLLQLPWQAHHPMPFRMPDMPSSVHSIFHIPCLCYLCLLSRVTHHGWMEKYCFPLDLQITAGTEGGGAARAIVAAAATHLDLSPHFNAGTERRFYWFVLL